jgi:hypothetical protein
MACCKVTFNFNPSNAKLNPICHLLALLGAHLILHVSRIRVKIVRHKVLVLLTVARLSPLNAWYGQTILLLYS